jgi:hypothetical protein
MEFLAKQRYCKNRLCTKIMPNPGLSRFFLLGMPCCRQHPARPLLQAKAEPMKASSEIARTAARSFLYKYPAGPSKNEKVEQFY